MARTTKTNRTATLEDVTRRCSVGVAARASTLEEGLGHAQKAKGQVADAEQQVMTGLASLQAVKPIFSGTTEYMLTCERLLTEVVGALETDVQELRSIQTALSGLEEPTSRILQGLLAYSVEAIHSRIRSRMNKLGGDLSEAALPHPAVNLAPAASPVRRRSDSLPPREFVPSEIEEGLSMDSLVQAGLDNFERAGAHLEACFESLGQAQASCSQAVRSLGALNEKYRVLERMESGATSPEINDAVIQVQELAQEVDLQVIRLERVAAAPDRARGPLLAVFENMGRLLMNGVVAEGTPSESRDVSAKEILQQALQGNLDALGEFSVQADDPQWQAMADALYQAARTEELGVALRAVEGLRKMALGSGDSRTDAGDNLLSLSNSPSAPEAVRSAANAALFDLTDGSGESP